MEQLLGSLYTCDHNRQDETRNRRTEQNTRTKKVQDVKHFWIVISVHHKVFDKRFVHTVSGRMVVAGVRRTTENNLETLATQHLTGGETRMHSEAKFCVFEFAGAQVTKETHVFAVGDDRHDGVIVGDERAHSYKFGRQNNGS